MTLICTTDDPADSLEWHQKLATDDSFEVKVLPAWRPDKAMNIEKVDFAAYMAKLSKAAGIEITDFASLKLALKNRMEFFASRGCSVSDHALEYVMYVPADPVEPVSYTHLDVYKRQVRYLMEARVLYIKCGLICICSASISRRSPRSCSCLFYTSAPYS